MQTTMACFFEFLVVFGTGTFQFTTLFTIKACVCQSLFGTRYAFYFYWMSSRWLGCVFVLYSDLRWTADDAKSVLRPSRIESSVGDANIEQKRHAVVCYLTTYCFHYYYYFCGGRNGSKTNSFVLNRTIFKQVMLFKLEVNVHLNTFTMEAYSNHVNLDSLSF